MNELNIKVNSKKNNIILVFSIIFFIFSLLFGYLFLQSKRNTDDKYINMYEFVKEKKSEINQKVYIDAILEPHLFAIYKTDSKEEENKYYIVMDNNKKLYITYMKEEKYEKISKEINEDKKNKVVIKGITKTLPTSIKELAIEEYNRTMDDNLLNYDNFQDYLGLVYVDTTYQVNKIDLYLLGVIIFFIIHFILFVKYLYLVIKNKRFLKNINQEVMEKISAELKQKKDSSYSKIDFYLLDDYIVDLNSKVIIINYNDIIWVYPYERRQNGLLLGKYIRIIDNKHKIYNVANTINLVDREKIIDEIIKKISLKNNNVILGYNKENKKKYEEILKSTKKKKKFI